MSRAFQLRLCDFASRGCFGHGRMRGAAEPRRDRLRRQGNGEFGLATRAMAALNSNDVPAAIGFAERAVAKTSERRGLPRAARQRLFRRWPLPVGRSRVQGFADALFEPAAGRAEARSGRDRSRQERRSAVIPRRGEGRARSCRLRACSGAGRSSGRRNFSARDSGSCARRRCAGSARTSRWPSPLPATGPMRGRSLRKTSPADQVDARIHQWMQLASPKKPSDQVAALVGVTPAAVDPGQPTQLALNKSDTRLAQAAPAVPQPQFAEAPPAPQPQVAEAAPPPPPVAVASAEQAPPVEQPVSVASAPAAAGDVSVATVAAPKAAVPAPKVVKAKRASAAPKRPPIRQAAARRGNSNAVVQLGSFRNPKSVLSAWNVAARRYSALRGYAPMSARFASARGTVFRLSVHGFASVNEASALCASLRRAAGPALSETSRATLQSRSRCADSQRLRGVS